MRLLPAPAGSGVVFRRTDLDNFEIPATGRNVAKVSYATSLMRQGVLISTTEHLLSALIGMGIDNLIVEIDNLELPILDGSALPYVEGWATKYKDAGLVVIGVHTPEFAFEKERSNVEKAVRDLQVTYPVAIDSNYGIWKSFNNEYWPAHYFIDGKGRIRYHHFIWHLFVIAGTTCHYLAVLWYGA